MQGGLHRGQQMPGLDLCAAGLCRQGSALFSEKGNKAPAAEARIYLGRGAVTFVTSARHSDARRSVSCNGEAMTKRAISTLSLSFAVALVLTIAANLAS